MRAGFFMTTVHGDLNNFYMMSHLDEISSLMSGIFLQTPQPGSKFPTLDPNVNRPLEVWLFTAARFGFSDAGGLSAISKGQ